MLAKLLQLYLTLCDLGTVAHQAPSVQGILQARILEWLTIPSSRGSSLAGDQTCISLSPNFTINMLKAARTYIYLPVYFSFFPLKGNEVTSHLEEIPLFSFDFYRLLPAVHWILCPCFQSVFTASFLSISFFLFSFLPEQLWLLLALTSALATPSTQASYLLDQFILTLALVILGQVAFALNPNFLCKIGIL